MDNESTLAQVRAALDTGLAHQALNIAKERQTCEFVNANLHSAWADVLEELALVDEVIFELNLVLRDDPERASIYEVCHGIILRNLDCVDPHWSRRQLGVRLARR
jgi:hypothetical protein